MKPSFDFVEMHGSEPTVSTMKIYKPLKITHRALVQLIQKHLDLFNKIRSIDFLKVNTGRGGKPAFYCRLNEEQSTFLINLMRNSESVVRFKFLLTREFYRMRNTLASMAMEKHNAEWMEKRDHARIGRKMETNVIKSFVEYATAQGSTSAFRYYTNLSVMENRALFFLEQKFPNVRDVLNMAQLSVIVGADLIVSKALSDGMAAGLNYKEIYVKAKTGVEQFAALVGQSVVPASDQFRLMPAPAPVAQLS